MGIYIVFMIFWIMSILSVKSDWWSFICYMNLDYKAKGIDLGCSPLSGKEPFGQACAELPDGLCPNLYWGTDGINAHNPCSIRPFIPPWSSWFKTVTRTSHGCANYRRMRVWLCIESWCMHAGFHLGILNLEWFHLEWFHLELKRKNSWFPSQLRNS